MEAKDKACAETAEVKKQLTAALKREREHIAATKQAQRQEEGVRQELARRETELGKERAASNAAKIAGNESRLDASTQGEAARTNMNMAMAARAELVKRTRELDQAAAKVKAERLELEAEKVGFVQSQAETTQLTRSELLAAECKASAMSAQFEQRLHSVEAENREMVASLSEALEEASKWKASSQEMDARLDEACRESHNRGREQGETEAGLHFEKSQLELDGKYLEECRELRRQLEAERLRCRLLENAQAEAKAVFAEEKASAASAFATEQRHVEEVKGEMEEKLRGVTTTAERELEAEREARLQAEALATAKESEMRKLQADLVDQAADQARNKAEAEAIAAAQAVAAQAAATRKEAKKAALTLLKEKQEVEAGKLLEAERARLEREGRVQVAEEAARLAASAKEAEEARRFRQVRERVCAEEARLASLEEAVKIKTEVAIEEARLKELEEAVERKAQELRGQEEREAATKKEHAAR